MVPAELRAWLGRLLLSVLLALLVGALSYLVARALSTGYALYQQQQFVQATAGVLRAGSVDELAGSNLRAMRLHIEALQASYALLSARIAFGAAALAGIGCYMWLEYQAAAAHAKTGG